MTALTALGLTVLALAALSVVVALTWLTFPVAAILRTWTGSDPARWVRQALGRRARLRDLGELAEAEVEIGDVALRVTWSKSHTRVEARGHQTEPPPASILRQLDRLGRTEQRDRLIWQADRPPDPQLERAVSLIVQALSR